MDFQKFSRWYDPHWGVVLFSILGFERSLMVFSSVSQMEFKTELLDQYGFYQLYEAHIVFI